MVQRSALMSSLVVAFITAMPVLAVPRAPLTSSPGSSRFGADVGTRCPTFSWGIVPDAERFHVVVYEVESEEGQAAVWAGEELPKLRPVLWNELPGEVTSWTPPLDRCLRAEETYAWGVRAVAADGAAGEWSQSRIFRVRSELRIEDVESALERVLARYLEERGGAVLAAEGAVGDLAGAILGVGRRTVDATPAPEVFIEGDAAVFGELTATDDVYFGLRGKTSSPINTSSGVVGQAVATTGVTYGVHGLTESSETGAAGVFGETEDGWTYGVFGKTFSSDPRSVGVRGETSGAGAGVEGVSLGGGVGVRGMTTTDSGFGLEGLADSGSGQAYGVRGDSASVDGAGVWGTGSFRGVLGSATGAEAFGGYFVNDVGTGLFASGGTTGNDIHLGGEGSIGSETNTVRIQGALLSDSLQITELTAENLTVNDTVTAGFYIGDGSQLTNVTITDLNCDGCINTLQIQDLGVEGSDLASQLLRSSTLDFQVEDSSNDAVSDILRVDHLLSSGNGAGGIGSGIEFRSVDDGGNLTSAGRVSAVLEDPGNAIGSIRLAAADSGPLTDVLIATPLGTAVTGDLSASTLTLGATTLDETALGTLTGGADASGLHDHSSLYVLGTDLGSVSAPTGASLIGIDSALTFGASVQEALDELRSTVDDGGVGIDLSGARFVGFDESTACPGGPVDDVQDGLACALAAAGTGVTLQDAYDGDPLVTLSSGTGELTLSDTEMGTFSSLRIEKSGANVNGQAAGVTVALAGSSNNPGTVTGLDLVLSGTHGGDVTGLSVDYSAGTFSGASIGLDVTMPLVGDLALNTNGSLMVGGGVSGGALTDGIATLASGALSGATSVTASGTVQGGTLTDGTASLTGGALTGATSVTASAAVQGGALTDGTATLSGGDLSTTGSLAADTVTAQTVLKVPVFDTAGVATCLTAQDTGKIHVTTVDPLAITVCVCTQNMEYVTLVGLQADC